MRKLLLGFAAVVQLGVLAAPASAGCVKGAIVGGLAGHMVGHGGMGAAAGCAYGAHKKNADNKQRGSEGRSGADDRGAPNKDRN